MKNKEKDVNQITSPYQYSDEHFFVSLYMESAKSNHRSLVFGISICHIGNNAISVSLFNDLTFFFNVIGYYREMQQQINAKLCL